MSTLSVFFLIKVALLQKWLWLCLMACVWSFAEIAGSLVLCWSWAQPLLLAEERPHLVLGLMQRKETSLRLLLLKGILRRMNYKSCFVHSFCVREVAKIMQNCRAFNVAF